MARRLSLHQRIVSRRTPLAAGSCAHAVLAKSGGSTLFVGQLLPWTLPKGVLSTAPAKVQAELLLVHLRDVLAAAHMQLDAVVSISITLVDLQAWAAWQAQLPKFFIGHSQPASTVLQVSALPGGATMGLSAVAVSAAEPAGHLGATAEPDYGDDSDAQALEEALDDG